MIKTRRIKSDQVVSLVNHYLKKRQYTDGTDASLKDKKSFCQGVEEMALIRAVTNESSNVNSFCYSSTSAEANNFQQQYARLKAVLLEAVEPFRSELLPFLYPFFVHIYLAMLCDGHKTQAHKFFSCHHALFLGEESKNTILNKFQHMFSKDDVISCPEINEFRENKFKLVLSEDAFNYLFRFLKTEECTVLLQMLNTKFDLRVGEAQCSSDPQQTDEKSADQMALASPPCTPENKVIQNGVSLSSLQQCIQKVRSGPPCLPSICLYTVENTAGLCCGDLNAGLDRLVIGSEDSVVRLWSLTPDKLRANPCSTNPAHIPLANDNPNDINQRINQHTMEDKQMVNLLGHSAAIYGVKFMSDNRYIISASGDTTVRLWDTTTHTSVCVYRGHNYPVWSLDASPIGGYFVTCSHDRMAKLWTTDRVFPLRNFIGHTADVNCVRFHPNCNYIATGGSDRVVRLWSVHDGQPVRLFQGHKSGIYSLAFSNDGKLLASAGDDRQIKLWDLNTGSLLKTFRGHIDTVYTLSFNPQSSILASGGLDGTIKLWNVENCAPINPAASPTQPANQETCSPELLESYSVSATTIHHLHYSNRNLLTAFGAST